MIQKWIRVMTGLAVVLLIARAGFTAEVTQNQPAKTASAEETQVLRTEKDALSYSLGVETVRSYKRVGIDVDYDLIIRGIRDAASGGRLLLPDEAIASALVEFRGQILARRQGERAVEFGNKKEGDTFLAANKTKEGVMVLPSGLQYKVLRAGEGRKPTAQDTVQVHYRGTLINGTQFESTYETGKPVTIKVSDPQIAPGVREALMLMAPGSKWQLFVPPKLAYSTVGKRPYIGPNMTLIYEVELLTIQEPGKAGGQ